MRRRMAWLVDPYQTTLFKVFAEGARVDEVPMPLWKDSELDSRIFPSRYDLENHFVLGEAFMKYPNSRKARRKMFRRLPYGAVPGYAPICFDTNDPLTVWSGGAQRACRVVPGDSPELKPFKSFCERKFDKWFARGLGRAVVPTFEEWLESTKNFNEERKQELRNANNENRGGVPPPSICEKVDGFCKTESYSLFKWPRWIMSRHDRFKVWFGPAVKAMEEKLYQLKWFVKHVPVSDRATVVAGLRKAGRRYYMVDFSAYESHFSPDRMEACEFVLMDCLLRDWIGKQQAKCTLSGWNRIKFRGWLHMIALVLARRMSGEMSTSAFNGIANLCLTKYIVHKKKGKVDILVEGDDSIFSTTVPISAQDYLDLGFTAKVVEIVDPWEPVPLDPNVEKGSMAFCGIFYAADGTALKEPRKFLTSFGWTHSFIHAGDKIMNMLLRAKALSAIYEAPQCPIIGAMAREALKRTHGVVIREDVWRATWKYNFGDYELPKNEVVVPEFKPSLEARSSFARVFGVSEPDQLRIEAALTGDISVVASVLPPTFDQLFYSSRYVVVG